MTLHNYAVHLPSSGAFFFRDNFMNVESSVVPDALIGLHLNLNVLQLMTAQRAFLQQHFECFRTLVKYLLAHTIMAIPYSVPFFTTLDYRNGIQFWWGLSLCWPW
jgi:hypothetical protein